MCPDLLYDRRHQVAVGLTACLIAAVIVIPLQHVLQTIREPDPPKPPPLVVELVAPEPAPVSPPPKLQETPRLQPEPVVRQLPAVHPARREQPASLVASAVPTPTEGGEPVMAPIPASRPADTPLREIPPPAPSPAPDRAAPNLQADQRYEAVLRTYIESRKSYPTGRQVALEKPEGTAYMCLRLDRKGSLLQASVRGSSGSSLLDQAARRLLAGLSYPPFEEMAFRGQDEHEFCVHLKYEAPQG